jgi:hypothetical protein
MTILLNFTSPGALLQTFQGRQIVDGLGIGVLPLVTSKILRFLPNLGKVGL